MGNKHLILKSICYLFMGVMVYMHVCSAWCAMTKEKNGCKMAKEGSEKMCCSHHQDSNKKEKGCQDFHLAFFKAAGQFSSENNVEVDKVFPVMPAILFAAKDIRPVDTYQNPVVSTQYHPPPPIADIRMFIRSFQI